jgi:hypothetical protein
VTLYKDIDGSFVRIATKRPTLDASSAYVATFGNPGTGTCTVRAKFNGDADHLPSSKTKIFTCT